MTGAQGRFLWNSLRAVRGSPVRKGHETLRQQGGILHALKRRSAVAVAGLHPFFVAAGQ